MTARILSRIKSAFNWAVLEVKRKGLYIELVRLLIAWVSLFSVGIWMVICQQWSDARWLNKQMKLGVVGSDSVETTVETLYEEHQKRWPQAIILCDWVLESMPKLEATWISDNLVVSSVVIAMVGGSLCARTWRNRIILLRRIAWIAAILYFIRSITISLTTLPPSSTTCPIVLPKSTWQLIVAIPDILSGKIGQCTDKIFSGHTAILFISFLFWQRYATYRIIVVYSAIHTAVGVFSVLAARYHYTVDVAIGFLLTYLIHHLYYASLDTAIRERLAIAANAEQHCSHCRSSNKQWAKAENASQRTNGCGDVDDDIIEDIELTAVSSRNNPGSSSITPVLGPIRPNGQFAFRKRDKPAHNDFADEQMISGDDSDGGTEMIRSSCEHHKVNIGNVGLDSSLNVSSDPEDCYLSKAQYQQMSSHGCDVFQSSGCEYSLISRSLGHGCPCLNNLQTRLGILGINRSPTSYLPDIVAWMDGLDIRLQKDM